MAKTAVERNRIRRRLYELVRQNESLQPKGYDTVFVVRDSRVAEIDHMALKDTVKKAIVHISRSRR